MTELAGNLAVIKASGSPLDLAEEPLERITDNKWRIGDDDLQVIDRNTTIVLERWDGAEWEEITYKNVNRLNGEFTFAGDGYDETESLRVKSGNYLPMAVVATAHSYTYNRAADMMDVSAFFDTHKKRIAGQKYASGTLSRWDVVDTYFESAITSGNAVVLEFRGTADGDPRRVWALLESDEMSAAIESPQEEVVSFVSTDELLNLGG